MRSVHRSMLAVLALCPAAVARAAPITVAHSGYLLDATDAPVSGPRSMTFELYDAGGTAVWTSAACSVVLEGGYYAVMLGGACNGTPALDSSHLPAGERR